MRNSPLVRGVGGADSTPTTARAARRPRGPSTRRVPQDDTPTVTPSSLPPSPPALEERDCALVPVPVRGVTPEPTPIRPALASLPLAVPDYRAARPFQYPSLGHLDTDINAAWERARMVLGKAEGSVVWTRTAYASFRRYLVSQQSERHFLAGEFDRQHRVLEGWISWMRMAEDLDRSTINGYWRALRCLLTWVTESTGMLNPLAVLKTPTYQRPQARWLTKVDAERLLTWVEHAPWASVLERTRNVAIVGFLLLAGLRRGEVLRLRFGDLNLDAGTFLIRRGKGRNGGRDRTGYLSPQLRTMVERYLAERRRAGRDHPELFTSLRGNHGISATVVQRLCRAASAGLGTHVHPHMLRHTFVTLCVFAGIPTRIIQLLTGHASLSMVEHYSHVVSADAQDAIRRIALDIDVGGWPLAA